MSAWSILDVDVHHGNGTQGIFYEQPDVLTVSIHADPRLLLSVSSGVMRMSAARVPVSAPISIFPLPMGTGDDDYIAGD